MIRVYIIPAAVHPTLEWPTGVTHHGQFDAATGTHLQFIDWRNAPWQDRERFEAQDGLIALGELWEPVPAEAIPTLEAFRQILVPIRQGLIVAKRAAPGRVIAPALDPAIAIDATHTVAQAIRKAAPYWAVS